MGTGLTLSVWKTTRGHVWDPWLRGLWFCSPAFMEEDGGEGPSPRLGELVGSRPQGLPCLLPFSVISAFPLPFSLFSPVSSLSPLSSALSSSSPSHMDLSLLSGNWFLYFGSPSSPSPEWHSSSNTTFYDDENAPDPWCLIQ